MSMHLHVYVGPYALISNPETMKRMDRCGHEPDDQSEGYCRTCGQGLAARWYETNTALVDPYDIWGDDLTEGHDNSTWLPNVTDLGQRIDPHGDESARSFTAEQMDREIQEFRSQYATQLAAMEAAGVPVAIRWGVVTCWY